MNTKTHKWSRAIVLILLVISAMVGAAQILTPVTEAQGDIPLTYGSSAFGTIDASAPSVTYTFNGTQGDLVEVDVQSVSRTLDPAVDLIGPDRILLANGEHHRLTMRSSDAHIAVFLTQGGTHIITVSGLNGSVGDYVLRLNGRPWASPTRLQYDVARDVNITENGPIQYFDFETDDCPTTLIVTNQFGGEPYTFPFVVRVRDARGQEVALLRGGNAQEDRVTVPGNSGRYEVEVFADDPALTGLISLLVTCAANAPGCDQVGGGEATTARDPDCPDCPLCTAFERPDHPGDTAECPDMDPRAVVVDPEVRGTLLTWNPVPGAEAYAIHIYGLRDGGEHYLGMAGAPGDATEFVFDHLFPGYNGFRFVVEAIIADAPVCVGETTVTFLERLDACPIVNLRGDVIDAEGRVIRWSWDPATSFDGYYLELFGMLADGSAVDLAIGYLEVESTHWDTHHAPEHLPTDTFRMTLYLVDGERLVCPVEAVVTFEDNRVDVCLDYAVSVAVSPEGNGEIHWPLVPGAVAYAVNIRGSDGVSLPGYPAGAGPDQDWHNVSGLAPGDYTVTVTAHAADGSVMCLSEQPFEIGSTQDATPCEVIAERDGVRVHVGPGRHRSVFTFMDAGRAYRVTGYNLAPDGSKWWELDKTQFPGHEVVFSLWVAEADVTERGNCTDIPQVDIPDIVPDEPGDDGGGGWGPCGSCDTCGHPASECVTDPSGACVWDPGTCGLDGSGGDDGGGDVPPNGGDDEPEPQCVFVTASVEPAGLGAAGPITSGNCFSEIQGNYTPNTFVQVQAIPNSGCWLDHWSGCGLSGSANPAGFTVNATCHAVAHIVCIQ